MAARAERIAAEQEAAKAGPREQTKAAPPPATAAQLREEHAQTKVGHAALPPSLDGAEDCCTAGTCRDDNTCPRGEDECCRAGTCDDNNCRRLPRRRTSRTCRRRKNCTGCDDKDCPVAGGGAPRRPPSPPAPPSPPPSPGGGDDCCAAGTCGDACGGGGALDLNSPTVRGWKQGLGLGLGLASPNP